MLGQIHDAVDALVWYARSVCLVFCFFPTASKSHFLSVEPQLFAIAQPILRWCSDFRECCD